MKGIKVKESLGGLTGVRNGPRTRPNSSQARFTSPRRLILSLLLLVVLGYSLTLRLDIGPGPFLRCLYI